MRTVSVMRNTSLGSWLCCGVHRRPLPGSEVPGPSTCCPAPGAGPFLGQSPVMFLPLPKLVCVQLPFPLCLVLSGWELKATDITKWAIAGRFSIVNHIEVYSHLLCSLTIYMSLALFFFKLLLCHFSSPVDSMMEWWRVSLEPVCLGLYWLHDLRQGKIFLFSMPQFPHAKWVLGKYNHL